MDMAMDMERGKLKPPLPLMPRLPQDIIMDIIAMAVMDTTDMVMERERPRLRLDTIMDTPMDMVDMVVMDIMDMVMERGRLSRLLSWTLSWIWPWIWSRIWIPWLSSNYLF